MILEKNISQRTAKSYIKFTASYVRVVVVPKKYQPSSITFKSHNGQALDHRRLIRPGKKSGRILCVRQVYFTKSCQQIWVRVPFYHLYITSEVTQYHEALFLSYRPRTECSISQFCNTNYTHSIFRTIEARVKKFPKSPIRPAGSHFCSLSCGRVCE